MSVEFVLGGFFAIFGLLVAVFHRRAEEIVVAGNYVIGPNRGALVNAFHRPLAIPVLGVLFLAFGVVAMVSSGGPFTATRAPMGRGELIILFVVAGVIALEALSLLLFRRRCAAVVARRLRANSGDLYEGHDVDRYSGTLVLTMSLGHFALAGLIASIATIWLTSQ